MHAVLLKAAEILKALSVSSILKIVSDALTALFAIIGMLTNFWEEDKEAKSKTHKAGQKKRKKVSLAGKISLSGVLIGLVVSISLIFVDAVNQGKEVNKHELEVATQETLLGNKITMGYTFYVKDGSTATRDAGILRANPPFISFYRGRVQCPTGYIRFAKDVAFYGPDVPTDGPAIIPGNPPNMAALLSWQVEMNVAQSTLALRGAAQIPGSTIVITTTGYGDGEMPLLDADIDLKNGFSFSVPERTATQTEATHTEADYPNPPNTPPLPLRITNYCYTFPSDIKPLPPATAPPPIAPMSK